MSQLLETQRSKLPSPSTFSALLVGNVPVFVVLLALAGLTVVTVVRWWKARARSFDARARRTYLPLYSVGSMGSRPGMQDGGKPGEQVRQCKGRLQYFLSVRILPGSLPGVKRWKRSEGR
jgi:hypothetical protein